MSITATEIQEVKFGEVKKGYNPDEVDEFLERVASDVDTLNRAIAEAANRIKAAEERARVAETKLAEQPAPSADVDAEYATDESVPAKTTISEDAISKAFIAAQISADRLKEEARKEAEKLYREADVKAKDIVRDAHSERQRILAEIDQLRTSSEKFRTDFLSLLNHYSADAQKRFPAFEELVPEAGGESGEESVQSQTQSLLAEGNAVVAVANSAAGTVNAATDVSAAPDLGATTVMPLPVSLALDDDLESEDID